MIAASATTAHSTPTNSPLPAQLPQPSFYVPIPQRLATHLYDTPLAIGVYAFVARLYQVAKAPVSLSAPDLMRYDPSLSRGAILRALDRLVGAGYLIARGDGRQKRAYTPAWGPIRGAPLAWDLAAPCLGRPRHVHALRLDQRLFDICMGKLAPHPMRAATITRYLTAPLLTLADIGAYALTLAGVPRTTPTLERLDLISDAEPRPLMSDARLLALASQQVLTDEPGAALTAGGARKLGVVPILPPATETAQPLFFVPPALIGGLIEPLIEPLIGYGVDHDEATGASQSGETAQDCDSGGITWMVMESRDSRNPPLAPPRTAAGRGGRQSNDLKRPDEAPSAVRSQGQPQRKSPIPLPDTESAQILRTINVRPEAIVELANVPLATVRQAVADAQARPYVRDVAAWAVSLIRASRDHGFTITPPAPPPDSAEALQAYFADLAARQEADRAMAASADEAPIPCVSGCDPVRDHASVDADTLPDLIRRELRWRVDRTLRPLVEQLEIRVLGDSVQLVCGRAEQTLTVQTQLLPIARAILCDLDKTGIQHITVGAAAPPIEQTMPPIEHATPPPWIAPARWAALPRMLRIALGGSRLEDGGVVVGASEHLTGLLCSRYAAEVAVLVAEYRTEPSVTQD
jgi:hypothetical protein